MGSCLATGTTDRLARDVDQKLSEVIVASSKKNETTYKLLLLGTGESGKSTVFKQMQILHEEGFSDVEQQTFRHVLRANVVDSMKALIEGAQSLGYQFEYKESEECAKRFLALDSLSGDFWIPQISYWINQLWEQEKVLKNAFQKHRAKLQILDSAPYLFDNIERFQPANFMPNKDDILRARLRTSGIIEREFKLGREIIFKFVDVGGQRNERRKWIHCFSDVMALIFVTAISEFDQSMYEDDDKNRLLESFEEFDKICNEYSHFNNSAIILFMNKMDIFEDKIKNNNDGLVPLFPEYEDFRRNNGTGKNPVELSKDFIGQKYLEEITRFVCSKCGKVMKSARVQPTCQHVAQKGGPVCGGKAGEEWQNPDQKVALKKRIFPHFTCATDTENVRKVFEAVKSTILNINLSNMGIMA